MEDEIELVGGEEERVEGDQEQVDWNFKRELRLNDPERLEVIDVYLPCAEQLVDNK